MPKTKQQKKEILRKLTEKFKESKGVVFAGFSGLTVKQADELRKKCREAEVEYFVAKKTLIKKALKEVGLAERDFAGEVAAAFSKKDEVAAAKTLYDFAKENEQISLLAGILEDKLIEEEQVQGLAKLPSKQELLAKLVGSINAPAGGMINVLAGNLRGLVQVLKAVQESKS